MNAKPFIKWVGGKTQLLPEIRKRYPEHFDKYCEPFVGGGAVLFDVLSNCTPSQVFINDINPELINAYRQIKDNTEELISFLKAVNSEYLASMNKKDYYYEKRMRFNELIVAGSDTVEKAALFIMLNKTCFNGLYRVNAKGLFNVPHNGADHPAICDEENIRNCGKLLQSTTITLGDYRKTADYIDERTFVYIDPPYRPLSVSSYFTSYNANGFTDENQKELAGFFRDMSKRGASVLLSNSDPKNADPYDNFFDDLYKDFAIERVQASRMINSKADGRGEISELLISSSYAKTED